MKSVARRLRTGDFGTGMRWAVPALVLFLAGCAGKQPLVPPTNSGSGNASSVSNASMASAAEADPRRRASIRLELAASYFQAGRIDVALEEVNQALAADPSSADGAIDPVGHGTGAFILKKANGSSGATLERNDKYWGTKATAPGIDVTYVPDGAARANALRTDTADIVEAVPVAQVGNIDKNLLHEVATPRTSTLYLNTRSGPFADPALRAAARNAVDPAALIKTVFEGHADSPVGLLGPAVPWAAELRAWKKETYPGASGAAATGKVPGATAAGTVPAGTAITLASYTDRPELGEMVPLLAQQLEATGFKVTQDVREYNQIESEALAGKFHAVLVSRSTVLDSGDAVAYMTADFSSSGSYSMSGLHDEKVDAAISKAAATQPGDERHKAIMAAEQAILASGAAIPLAHERVIQGEAAGVTGAQRDPGERALITSATTVKK